MPENLKQGEGGSPSTNQAELEDQQLETALFRAKREFNKHKKNFGKKVVNGAFEEFEEIAYDGTLSANNINEFLADPKKVELFIEKRKDFFSEKEICLLKNLQTGIDDARNKSGEAAKHSHVAASNTRDSKVITTALIVGTILAVGSPFIAVLEKPATDGLDDFLHQKGNSSDKAIAQFVLSNISANNFSVINNYATYNNATTINNYYEDQDRNYKNQSSVRPKRMYAANRTKQFHRQPL
jgi:hypothetical protein